MTEKKLHIGFDAKRYFQNNTGLGNYSHHIIDGLSALYPEIDKTLFTTAQAKISQTKIIYPRTSKILAKFWRILNITKGSAFQKLDVFHGLSNELPWRRTKVKTVVTVHDIIFKHLPQTQHPFNRWIYDFKTKRACTLASLVIATSKHTKKDLVKFYKIPGSKIEVVYQDCDPMFYNYTSDKSILDKYKIAKPYILCVGTIEERKSQLLLIKAFEDLQFAGNLVIVGKKTKFYSQIADFLKDKPELEKRIQFIENASFRDFPNLYHFASLFAYPSICEGFGIPVLEAMNTGTPVVSTKNTVMEEVCEDAAIYYDKHSKESLTKAMQTVLDSKEIQEELVQKGKKRALLFRKEINIPQLVELYKKL